MAQVDLAQRFCFNISVLEMKLVPWCHAIHDAFIDWYLHNATGAGRTTQGGLLKCSEISIEFTAI